MLNRINAIDEGEPVRLGGEGDFAPDGNLRYPGLASNSNITSIPLIESDNAKKQEAMYNQFKANQSFDALEEAINEMK